MRKPRSERQPLINEGAYWDEIASGWQSGGYNNEVLSLHKKQVYHRLIDRWCTPNSCQTILKTDLFAEAFEPSTFLFDFEAASNRIIGIDVSMEIVSAARRNAAEKEAGIDKYFCCNVKQLPIGNDSIDLVISDSTLDHFPDVDDISVSLSELARVLKPGGVLVLTLDNSRNLTYPPYWLIRLWMKLGLTPYFVGRTVPLSRLKQMLAQAGLVVEDSTAIFHYPHPDALVRGAESVVRRLSGKRADKHILKCLAWTDRLENSRSRYLTGRYIAVRAVKNQPA
jgi:SAM-dependent methyltransferase